VTASSHLPRKGDNTHGFVISVGTRRGVADIAGITSGGHLAHLLKDAIEWEYRQSVRHLRGWDPAAR
jgi:NADH dehydrogenase FAD-containing subunit